MIWRPLTDRCTIRLRPIEVSGYLTVNENNANSKTSASARKKRIGLGTIFLTVVLCIPWILVSVPGFRERAHTKQDPGWRGRQTVLTFGWPYVHAVRLEVDPRLYDKLGRVAGTDQVGATPERLDACLQSLGWTEVWSLKKLTPTPDLMKARPFDGYDLEDDAGTTFWSAPENWRYWDENSTTKWYSTGLWLNLLFFCFYVAVLVVVLEFFRRRRRKWYQLSLVDFLALCVLVGVPTGMAMAEIRYGKQQQAFATKLYSIDGVQANISRKSPALMARLFDGSNGWKRFVPEDAFRRLTRLEVDTWKTESDSEFSTCR